MKISIYGFPLKNTTTASVTSFNGRVGNIVTQPGDYTASMVGAEAIGTASDYFTSHLISIDPHEEYQKELELESILDTLIITYTNTINV